VENNSIILTLLVWGHRVAGVQVKMGHFLHDGLVRNLSGHPVDCGRLGALSLVRQLGHFFARLAQIDHKVVNGISVALVVGEAEMKAKSN
jgi:hypothetical protein